MHKPIAIAILLSLSCADDRHRDSCEPCRPEDSIVINTTVPWIVPIVETAIANVKKRGRATCVRFSAMDDLIERREYRYIYVAEVELAKRCVESHVFRDSDGYILAGIIGIDSTCNSGKTVLTNALSGEISRLVDPH